MYEEILEDPKIRTLPGELFKTWTYILALASRYRRRNPDRACVAVFVAPF